MARIEILPRSPLSVTCAICSVMFERNPGYKAKYCGAECRAEARRRRQRERLASDPEHAERRRGQVRLARAKGRKPFKVTACDVCHLDFVQKRRGKTRVCSDKCRTSRDRAVWNAWYRLNGDVVRERSNDWREANYVPTGGPTGFHDDLPAVTYLLHNPALSAVKVGISNNWSSRREKLGKAWNVLTMQGFAVGADARELERSVLSEWGESVSFLSEDQIHSGWTETAHESCIDSAMALMSLA